LRMCVSQASTEFGGTPPIPIGGLVPINAIPIVNTDSNPPTFEVSECGRWNLNRPFVRAPRDQTTFVLNVRPHVR